MQNVPVHCRASDGLYRRAQGLFFFFGMSLLNMLVDD